MKNDFSVVKPEVHFHFFDSDEFGKGVIKLFRDAFAPRLAIQEGKAKCIAAQYEKDAQDIAAGRKLWKEGSVVPAPKVSTFGDLCKVMVQNESDYKAKCLERALLVAASIIQKTPDEDISDEPVNQTFLNHWREEAELIDDDDLRELWANLLVEETCKPNSISPRTLNVVKNLSRKDAEAFERLCQLFFCSNIIVNERGIPLNGTYEDILLLMDAGLISQVSNGHLIPDLDERPNILFFENEDCFLRSDCMKLDYYCHVLTNAGLQIVKFIDKKDVLNNMKIIAKELSKQNNDTQIHLVKRIDGIPDDQAPEIWNTTQEI